MTRKMFFLYDDNNGECDHAINDQEIREFRSLMTDDKRLAEYILVNRHAYCYWTREVQDSKLRVIEVEEELKGASVA